MKHKIKVVILPTEDNSCMCVGKGKLYYYPSPRWFTKDFETQPQHIYITVSQDVEPIKEGDWAMYLECATEEEPFKGADPYLVIDIDEVHWNDRKIIATDDPKLTSLDILKVGDTVVSNEIDCNKQTITTRKLAETYNLSDHYFKQIPQVHQSFLEEFVANPDGEWEVEYETIHADRAPNGFEHLIKLNQDNTVNITPVKGEIILTRAQLKNILHCATGNVKDFVMHEDRFINDWIKQNL